MPDLAKVMGQPPAPDLVEVNINLAPFANRITLDGMVFFHGGKYTVPRSVANSLVDVMSQTWRHEREVRGEVNPNAYRRPFDSEISETRGRVR